MITINKVPEPKFFDSRVRQRGVDYLARTPMPTSKQFSNHDYWNDIKNEFRECYNHTCAYCGHMIIGGCIDHFQPKSHFPHLAYEWDNYRLADPEINQFKGNKTGIIDPFVVELGWFVMDLPSCLLKPGKNISQSIHDNIIYTIEELRLNSHDTLVRIREKIILNYIDQNISIEFLSENYPYIFAELNRQNALDIDYLKTIFIRY